MSHARLFVALATAILAQGCASGGNADPAEYPESIQSSGRKLEELFAGQFPGVEVYKVPSGGISIRIRGSSTFMGSTEPLFIIDGAKVQSGPNGLLFLDPTEIKSIEVLKDIGSTAIYGSEGANGVVIITTKRSVK